MRRLLRRSGVMLASLGLAIGALLAPVSVAPAQAADPNYDYSWYTFTKTGSWWFASSTNCFTEYYEDLFTVKIRNNGNETHQFQWVWTDYYNNPGHTSDKWTIYAHSSMTWSVDPPGGYGALHQIDHPRLKIYWWNSSGNRVLLWDLHGWSPDAFDPPADYGGSSYGC
jgi:hypothetical protein